MGIKSLGNSISSFRNKFGNTGNRASLPFEIKIVATGGTKSFANGFTYHAFTGPGTFSVTKGEGNIRLLLIGGGGGGGTEQGSGGGAAACIYRETVAVTSQSYPVSIGAGGAAGSPGGLNPGSNGTDSTAFGFTSDAGGSGGSRWHRGGSGGSAGGGTYFPPGGGGVTTGANPHPGAVDVESPPAGWGNPGGPTNESPQRNRAGGGGAGAAGGNGVGSGTGGGIGGTGVGFTWIPSSYGTSGPDGSARYFAGGGSGGNYNSNTPAPATVGGGGAGAFGPDPNGAYTAGAGTVNTGSGGGGGSSNYGQGNIGGSGICIVRYKS